MEENKQTAKFLTLLVTLLVSGFSLTSWISYRVSHQTLRRQIIDNELPLTSDNIYSEIQRDLVPPVFIASLMANNSFLRNWVISGEKDPEKITQFLAETQRNYNTFTSFFVSERTRLYYQSKGILKTVTNDNAQDSWYFRVRQMQADHEMNVDPDQANQYALAIFVNHKVYDFDGNYIGATGVGLNAGDVKQLIEDYHKKFNRAVNFIASNGQIVLSTENPEGSNIRELPGFSVIAPQILKEPAASLEYQHDGKTFYVNSRYIPELNWTLLVSKSDEAALQNIFHSLLLNLCLCGLVTVIVIILVYLIVNSYRRRLKSMFLLELELKNRNDVQQDEIARQHQQLVEQNAKLLQLNASKDKFFSIIAHDLRSPLGNLDQLAHLISESLEAGRLEEVKEYLADQQELSASTLKLLDHLFDWARSQMSEITCVADDFSLYDSLRECLTGIEFQANEKKIALTLQCPGDIVVNANRNMVMTIVRNLASNAIKFTPRGGAIEISAVTTPDGVTVSVKDSGVGIAADRLEKLFNSVYNKSTSGTEGEYGTGLGLALCRELIHKNGGEIKAESTPGTGSIFRFTLRNAKGLGPGVS